MSLKSLNKSLDAIFTERIASLQAEHRFRTPIEATIEGAYITVEGKRYLNFSSNDYLGLGQSDALKDAATRATAEFGTGAGASKLVTGNHPLYKELESSIAKLKGKESAVVFGSGYLANMGTIPCLVGKEDLVLADKLCHACILDGIQLSGAKLIRFKHNDLSDLKSKLQANEGKFGNILIITETVFSMDGDLAPISKISELSKECGAWLMVDDAHGFGVVKDASADADIVMGTFSKGAGSYGGYVCADKTVIDYIKSAARPHMFSTGLPPAVVAASGAAINKIEKAVYPVKSVKYSNIFIQNINNGQKAQSAIVPIIIGDEKAALEAQDKLKAKGFWVQAIRPPAVANNTSRLRITFTAYHTEDDVLSLANAIKELELV